MAKVPKYDDLLLPTLVALSELGGSGTIDEITDKVASLTNMDDDQLARTYEKSGALIFADRCSWARSYLKIAGLTASPSRGIWTISDTGKQFLKRDEDALKQAVAKAYNARAKTYKSSQKTGNDPDAETPSDNMSGDWTSDLLQIILSNSPDHFERLSQRLLREAGFTKVEVLGKPGDGGIDGIGVLRLNLVSFQVYFQCKRYQGSVGSGAVRDFRGAMAGRADKGLIITTGTFTSSARAEATRDGAPAIDLVDGEDLCHLLKQYKLGVTTELVETVTLDPEFFSDL